MTNLQNAILEASNNDLISYSEASSMLNAIMEAGKSIIEMINSIDGLKSLKPASSEDIKEAEDELGLKFSSEYVQYTKKFGAISFYGTELTGVGVPKGLNVVNRTKSERNMNKSFPSDCYVIENGDEVVVVSDSSGKIYKIAGNQKKMIHPSLSAYINECISRKAVKESYNFFESVRDTRKPVAYFNKFISYEENRIKEKSDKLDKCDSKDAAMRVASSLFLFQMNLLIASFSKGESKSDLKSIYHDCVTTAMRMKNLTYEDALRLVSLAIILDATDDFELVYNHFKDIFSSDKLLKGVSSYAITGYASWSGSYKFPAIFSGIDDIINANSKEAKEKAILSYLGTWYDNNEDSSWYNTLNSGNNTYYGYWSFESGALAIIFGLNTSKLSSNEYFPKI